MDINDEKSLDIMELLYSIKRKWMIIVFITIVGTILAYCRVTFLTKPIYSSYAKVILNNEGSVTIEQNGEKSDLMDIYIDIIKIPNFIENVVKNQKLNVAPGKVLGGVTVSRNKIFLDIAYASNDPKEIKTVIDAIIKELPVYSKSVIENNGRLKVIQDAIIPKYPIGPDKFKNTLYGFGGGFVIGLIIVFLQHYLDNSFKKSEDIEQELGLIVVGEIPKLDRGESKRIEKKKKLKLPKKSKERGKIIECEKKSDNDSKVVNSTLTIEKNILGDKDNINENNDFEISNKEEMLKNNKGGGDNSNDHS